MSQGESAVAEPHADVSERGSAAEVPRAQPDEPGQGRDARRADVTGAGSAGPDDADWGPEPGHEAGLASQAEPGNAAGPVGAREPEDAAEPAATGDSAGSARDVPPVAGGADLEYEGEIAADYVEGLLDVADLDGDIDMDVEGDRAVVSVVGATLDELVGPRGNVLEALQELTRLAVHRQTGSRTRVMLDIGGYRIRRRSELAEAAQEAAAEVKRTGQPKTMWAMNPFERKIVHDAIAAAGLGSESEGEEPDRKVVVLPAG